MKYIFFIVMFAFLSVNMDAQTSRYQVIKSETVSSTTVKLIFTVYCNKKKLCDKEAELAALRIALFDGCPNTQYSRALLSDGENTSLQKMPSYFNELYNNRVEDFVTKCIQTSDFKKADDKKGTQYEAQVKVLQLRRDLENNGITKRFGL